MLILRRVARVVLHAARESEVEVGRVIRHRLLARDVHLHVAQAQVLRCRHQVGDRCQRVALHRGQRLQHVVQVQVRVERTVQRRGLLLLVRVVERQVQLHLLREETSQVKARGHGILVIVIDAALAHTLLQSAETGRLGTSAHVHATRVGQLHVQRTLRSPTALVVESRQAQLVEPYLDGLGRARVVAHTHHHRLHLTDRRVTHHADAVLRVLLIKFRVYLRLRHLRVAVCGEVASALQLRQLGEVDVQHVLFRPHRLASVRRVTVVVTLRSDRERNLIFVVVALVVRSQAHEYRHLAILHLIGHIHQVLGMDIHLHMLIPAQIQVRLVIYGPRLVRLQSRNLQTHCLLVVLSQLRLRGVQHTRDARRHGIVHRHAVAVLLDVHRCHHHATAHLRSLVHRREYRLVVAAPCAADKLHCSQTHDHRFAESRHVDTHEAQRGEVAYASHHLLVAVDGHAELIPVHRLRIAVAQLRAVSTHVRDVVTSHGHVLRAQRYAVFEVFLIFIQRVVLVDVLHVGCCLRTLVVARAALR